MLTSPFELGAQSGALLLQEQLPPNSLNLNCFFVTLVQLCI